MATTTAPATAPAPAAPVVDPEVENREVSNYPLTPNSKVMRH